GTLSTTHAAPSAGNTRALRSFSLTHRSRAQGNDAVDKPCHALSPRTGKVYLVGAGPGDPDLLTLKAARLISNAEAVVYDHLVGPAILELIPPQARRVYVGKEAGNHALPQDGINALLVEFAREGLQVVRLKGGDPFI